MTNEFQERRQRKADRKRTAAENAQRRADAARDKARKLADGIPLGQPILVGHHSEKRHRRDLNRIHGGFERSRDEQDKANTLLGSAIAIESDTSISKWDPDAADKLAVKIAELEAIIARRKEINAALRKNDGKDLFLTARECDDIQSVLHAFYSASAKTFKGLDTSNPNGNLRRYKQRLADVQRTAERTGGGFLRTVPNKYAGDCHDCGTRVEPNAGHYGSKLDGSNGVFCTDCGPAPEVPIPATERAVGPCGFCGGICSPVDDWTCRWCGHTYPGGVTSPAPAGVYGDPARWDVLVVEVPK